MMFKKCRHCVAVLIAVVSLEANATGYFGIGIGDSSWDITDFGLFELEEATAFNFFGGAKSGHTGFEVKFSIAGYDWVDTGDATHNASNLAVFGVYFIPVSERVDVFGKLGLNLWSTDVDFLGLNYDGDDGIDIAYGIGFDINVTRRIFLRLEYEVFPGLEDGVDEGDVDQVMLNLGWAY